MIVLNEIKKEENYSHSIVVTYPRTVQISHGVYDNTVDMMNMITMISQNVNKDEELTNVYGGKTPWTFFNDTPEFKRFFEYVVNKHQSTNIFFNVDQNPNRKINFQAWGNELKKGDFVKIHNHTSYHLILYLTEGNELILPELKIKLKPSMGCYYVFPPYLLHYVDEVKEDNKRYCLVANITEQTDWKKNKIVEEFKNKKNV